MRKIKFRFWCKAGKSFIKDYKYNGLVDELFEQDDFLIPSEFTGAYDREGKELYEGDIIEVSHDSKKGRISFKFGAFLLHSIFAHMKDFQVHIRI